MYQKNLTTFTKMLSMVVDIKSYQMVLSLTKKLKKKNSLKKKLKIGTTCNINPEKNLELLIKLAKITPEFTYYIVGPIYATQKKYFLKIKKRN